MTVPKWIEEAIEVSTVLSRGGEAFPVLRVLDSEKLAAALLEGLPIERMVRAAAVVPYVDTEVPVAVRVDAVREILGKAITALVDGDQDVVSLTEMYRIACRALDVAGVPYANADEVPVPLDLAARIRWLAMQRPTRLDLQRVEVERDEARARVKELEERANYGWAEYTGW